MCFWPTWKECLVHRTASASFLTLALSKVNPVGNGLPSGLDQGHVFSASTAQLGCARLGAPCPRASTMAVRQSEYCRGAWPPQPQESCQVSAVPSMIHSVLAEKPGDEVETVLPGSFSSYVGSQCQAHLFPALLGWVCWARSPPLGHCHRCCRDRAGKCARWLTCTHSCVLSAPPAVDEY